MSDLYSRDEIVQALSFCFGALPEEFRDNLKWHAKNKTPVFCGESADTQWTDGKGTG